VAERSGDTAFGRKTITVGSCDARPCKSGVALRFPPQSKKFCRALPADNPVYEIGLLMDDPEDKSLLPQVGVMAKALTPVEMECVPAVLMADDQSLRNLSKQKPPFYARPDFLKA
jgi:hypothetical protein